MGCGTRGDSEMTIAMLKAEVDRRRIELAELQERMREEVSGHIRIALGEGEYGYMGDDGVLAPEMETRRISVELETASQRARRLQNGMNRFAVEYHKKFAIPVASIIFVLIGAPLAVRFPHGGVGMVIEVGRAHV